MASFNKQKILAFLKKYKFSLILGSLGGLSLLVAAYFYYLKIGDIQKAEEIRRMVKEMIEWFDEIKRNPPV